MNDYEKLNSTFAYCPFTGEFFWRINAGQRGRKGRAAGTLNTTGYRRLTINGAFYQAHRVAWLLAFGEWPSDEIDHIDGVKDNNALTNLRCVTRSDNNKNMKTYKNNISGHIGVHWHSANKKWRASISVDKKRISLGCYNDINSAVKARKAAEHKYGFHKNHGRGV